FKKLRMDTMLASYHRPHFSSLTSATARRNPYRVIANKTTAPHVPGLITKRVIQMFTKKILASAITAALLPSLALAAALEEVVVTAQKRSQSINEVGLSVSAATGSQLEALGVVDTADLVKISPGLTFTTSQNGTPLFSL